MTLAITCDRCQRLTAGSFTYGDRQVPSLLSTTGRRVEIVCMECAGGDPTPWHAQIHVPGCRCEGCNLPPLTWHVTESVVLADEARMRAIRAVVAAQWAAAIAILNELECEQVERKRNGWVYRDDCVTGPDPHAHYIAEDIAALPTPEQVVDGTG